MFKYMYIHIRRYGIVYNLLMQYITMIVSRVGGWMNENNVISIILQMSGPCVCERVCIHLALPDKNFANPIIIL